MGYFYLLAALLIIALAVIFYQFRKIRRLEGNLSGMVPADRAPESEGPQRDRFEIKLVSMLAHNFRGSFVNIISLMDFYKKGQVPPDQFEDLFEELKATSAQHLASFEITLRWLKTQLPGFVYKPLAISASDSVRDAIRNNISEIERKKISLRVIGGNERWFFYADPELLGFVLNNLLNNAVKYSFPSGKIECIIGGIRDKNGTMVKVQIVDHGLGMDAKTRESLFCHDKTIYTGTEGEKGAGIALLICKEFIELQGGRIEVESEIGQGAVFAVYIPGKTENPAEASCNSNSGLFVTDDPVPLNYSMLREKAYGFKGPGGG